MMAGTRPIPVSPSLAVQALPLEAKRLLALDRTGNGGLDRPQPKNRVFESRAVVTKEMDCLCCSK